MITKLLSFMFNKSLVNIYFTCEFDDERNIGNGARQGSILFQILFNFRFDDVIERTLELKVGCKLDAKNYHIIAHADDIALLLPFKTELKLLKDNLSDFLAKMYLFVNAEESS